MPTVTTRPELEPDALLALSDEEFRAVVDRGLRQRSNADPETAKALRHPRVIDRFYFTVLSMQKSIEAQFGAKRAELEQRRTELLKQGASGKQAALQAMQDDAKWRAGAIRFKLGVDEIVLEIRRLREAARSDLYREFAIEERAFLAKRVRDLEDTIRRHRDSFPEDEDPSESDEELWAWLPDSEGPN